MRGVQGRIALSKVNLHSPWSRAPRDPFIYDNVSILTARTSATLRFMREKRKGELRGKKEREKKLKKKIKGKRGKGKKKKEEESRSNNKGTLRNTFADIDIDFETVLCVRN